MGREGRELTTLKSTSSTTGLSYLFIKKVLPVIALNLLLLQQTSSYPQTQHLAPRKWRASFKSSLSKLGAATRSIFDDNKATEITEEQQAIRYLMTQYTKEGHVAEKIDIRWDDRKGWGVYAKEEMNADDAIFTIPKEECISVQSVLSDDVVGKAAHNLLEMFEYPSQATGAILALGLLKEYASQESSPHYHFITSMRWNSYDASNILLWSDKEVDFLKETSAHDKVVKLRTWGQIKIQAIAETLPETLQTFFGDDLQAASARACHLVNTRAIGVPPSKSLAYPTAVLVPLMDMLNHSPRPQERTSRFFAFPEGGVVAEICKDTKVENGKEITICYRPMDNSDLFSKYGFTVDDDQFVWSAAVNLQLDTSDRNFEDKKQLLKKNRLFHAKGKYCFLRMKTMSGYFHLEPDDLAILQILSIQDRTFLKAQGQSLISSALSIKNTPSKPEWWGERKNTFELQDQTNAATSALVDMKDMVSDTLAAMCREKLKVLLNSHGRASNKHKEEEEEEKSRDPDLQKQRSEIAAGLVAQEIAVLESYI